MKVVDGLINAKKPRPPDPKPSPKDFVWPKTDHDDKVAQKLAASLQELLPARNWKHTDLARVLYGTMGANESPRNPSPVRRWVVAAHPIPNENTAAYIAEVLGVSMARLLEPEGKYDPTPAMIRPRSDSVRFPSGNKPKAKMKTKKADKTPSGRDREKQRAYNAAYRARQRAKTKGEPSYYMRKNLEKLKAGKKRKNGHNGAAPAIWALPEGVAPPEYTISSTDEHTGHVSFELKAVLPVERAMAILHMLKQGEASE
jgi:hypothetical protein